MHGVGCVWMTLTGKQRSVLRGLGQRMDVAVTVGKGGIADSLVRELDRLLANRELVKVRLPAARREERHEAAVNLAAACEAELAGEVGHTALLYRANEQRDPSTIHYTLTCTTVAGGKPLK